MSNLDASARKWLHDNLAEVTVALALASARLSVTDEQPFAVEDSTATDE